MFAKLCTVRLACGEDAGKWLYREQKFTVLNNGIETNKYLFSDSVRSITRKELGVKENEILLGHIGNFIEQKNHTFLIDIFSEVHRTNPEFKLLLISDGMLMPTIKDKVHSLELDDAVVFLGKTMNVQNYLSAMDLFLLPSLHEGLPLVLVEAQASGLTCVVSDTVAREADLTETSWYLPISTVEPWSKIIRDKNYLGKNRNERSKQNIERIKENGYDLEQNANLLRQIYIDSCEER